MFAIAGKTAPVQAAVHRPETAEGKLELALLAAHVYADTVSQYIQQCACPTEQKSALFHAVLSAAAENKAGGQAP